MTKTHLGQRIYHSPRRQGLSQILSSAPACQCATHGKTTQTQYQSSEALTKTQQTIFFGPNDACVPGHEQHVPLEEYKENLKRIIQHPATQAQNPRIVLITPPPINEYQLEAFDSEKENPHPSRTASLAKSYAEAAREVAASLNVPAADIWSAFMARVGWKEGQPLVGSRDLPNNDQFCSLFTDGKNRQLPVSIQCCTDGLIAGLHLTPTGYRIVYGEVLKVIRQNWPDQDPEQLPFVFPSWVDAPK